MSTHTAEEQRQCDLSADDLADLPPSAKLVLQSLQHTDGMTTSQLAEETQFAERTVRYALTRLDEIGVIESQYLLSDPQTCKYLLTTDAPQSGERLD
ncbi:winged helix-turn-helix domain-containing protein [Halorientalis halophila]|uniref:winged helix-turn-helix domain-containing protein n=1 Tax=Halorientalis halophila TaxID=3108499 RepID=UPI00300BB1B9